MQGYLHTLLSAYLAREQSVGAAERATLANRQI